MFKFRAAPAICQLSRGVSKEWRRPMAMLSEDDVGRVDQSY